MAKKEKQYSIGIDIGGTKMLGILYDGQKVLLDYTLATPVDTLDHFLIMLNALAEPLLEKAKTDKAKIQKIGVGLAATIDYKDRKIINSPNIPILNNTKIANLIEEKLNLPAIIDNDTNCFLRGEMQAGIGQKINNAFGMIIGTGVGGAWWLDGDIYKGSISGANEPGEMIIDYTKEIKLENAYHQLFQNNVKSMSEDAYRGDPLAQKAFEEWGLILGIALANIANVLDPEAIIIGGGSIGAGDLYISAAKKTMRKYINPVLAKKIKILRSKLGPQAGAIGAALLLEDNI